MTNNTCNTLIIYFGYKTQIGYGFYYPYQTQRPDPIKDLCVFKQEQKKSIVSPQPMTNDQTTLLHNK